MRESQKKFSLIYANDLAWRKRPIRHLENSAEIAKEICEIDCQYDR